MSTRLYIALIMVCLIGMTSTTCNRNLKKDKHILISKLNYAIIEEDPFEAAKILKILKENKVNPKDIPIAKIAELIWDKGHHACNSMEDLILLYGPLEGLVNDMWLEHPIRGCYFWGLMSQGQRKRALELWEKSEVVFKWRWEESQFLFEKRALPWDNPKNQRNLRHAIRFFTLGFLSSHQKEDKRKAVEIANKDYNWTLSSVNRNVDDIKLIYPMTRTQKIQLMSDDAYSLLKYSLVKSYLMGDVHSNPFLEDQPQTDIRFEKVEDTGFEGVFPQRPYSDNRIGNRDKYDKIVLGDFDNDNYVDVLIPSYGLWRNLKGSGKFDRIDKKYSVAIHGLCGALCDVNNDGLVDIITANRNMFNVLLQTKSQIFKPILNVSNACAEFPVAIGLFDGNADGYIDVYLASYIGGRDSRGIKGTADVVLCNNGDGTFVDVTEAWNFEKNHIMYCGSGVSPADYDDDGYTDIFVSNYGLMPNTLWHNSSKNQKNIFIQCAEFPFFNENTKGKISKVEEANVSGIASDTSVAPVICYGHTEGSAWGDLNNDGTLDLFVSNFAHPLPVFRGYSDISHVYLNTGNDFKDHTINAGLVYSETSEDPLLADFNNDGILDLSVTNSYSIHVNQLYEGFGDGSFKEVTFRTGAFVCNTIGQASGDFDNDGDLDWFVFDGSKGMIIYENKLIDNGVIPDTANWIQFKLHGRNSVNTMAFGARITLKAGIKEYVKEVTGMRGSSNCDDQVVHFGLGEYRGKVCVEIRWIGNKVQKIAELEINRRHKIFQDYIKDK